MATRSAAHTEHILLHLLEGQIVPLGAGATKDALSQQGINVGEATAGRMLRQLERAGLARKIGVQGRVLTEKGLQRLRELDHEKKQSTSAEEFIQSLKATDSKELEDVLVARRAIESETARLAAENASAKEIEILREIIGEMLEGLRKGGDIASSDENFHLCLARMSKNHVLEAALKLIRHNGNYSPLLAGIRTHAGTLTGKDHLRICRAVEAHDGEAASLAMIDHINGVLEDVRKQLGDPKGRETDRNI
jgi:GntR family L-lactate dehydrogenase operon transcriptional regulator